MKLSKLGKYYHARVRAQNGQHVRVSTKATNKKEAQRVVKASGLDKLELAARTHRLTREGITRIITGQKTTVTRAIDGYSAWLAHTGRSPHSTASGLQQVRCFARELGIEKESPINISEKMINHWINNPDSRAKLSYRRVMLSHISSFLNFCAAKGWSIGNPALLVRINMNVLSHEQKETRAVLLFTPAEIQRLIAHTNDFWQFAVAISSETGLRLSDIAQLEWGCFQNPGEVIVWTDKRDKRVAVPISRGLQDMLANLSVTNAHFLFPEQRTILTAPQRRALLSMQFKRLCAKLGIKGKTFHGIRHTAITRWKKEGKTLEEIGRLVGHTNEATTKQYIHA